MLLTFNGARYNFTCTYDEREVPKEAGFKWDQRRRQWYTGQDALAKLLIQYADERAKARLATMEERVAMSRAINNINDIPVDEYEIPAPKGLEYMPFQKAGILLALHRFGFDIEQLRKK